MSNQEKDLEPLGDTEKTSGQRDRFLDDETYNKRKMAARLFAMAGIVVFAVWGASFFRDTFPHRVELRYIYKDIPDIHLLTRVVSSVKGETGHQGNVMFFHHDPIPKGGEQYFRKQKLKLSKGTYQVNVILRFKNRKPRTMTSRLTIREAGRYYVYLKKAK